MYSFYSALQVHLLRKKSTHNRNIYHNGLLSKKYRQQKHSTILNGKYRTPVTVDIVLWIINKVFIFFVDLKKMF